MSRILMSPTTQVCCLIANNQKTTLKELFCCEYFINLSMITSISSIMSRTCYNKVATHNGNYL